MGDRDGAWRRARLAAARLYLCTPLRADLGAFLDAVLAAGVDVVQLRDKEAAPDALLGAAIAMRTVAERHRALFIVNDDPFLAVEAGADGVHVGQDDPSPAAARHVVGPARLVGRSTHSIPEIDRALREPCDYFAVGPVVPTPTKEGREGIGWGPVEHAAVVSSGRPWFVTGGMAPATLPEATAHGVRRAVVVRALTESDDPAAIAARMAGLLE